MSGKTKIFPVIVSYDTDNFIKIRLMVKEKGLKIPNAEQ